MCHAVLLKTNIPMEIYNDPNKPIKHIDAIKSIGYVMTSAHALHAQVTSASKTGIAYTIVKTLRENNRRADSEMYCNLKKNIINMKKTLLTYCLNNAHSDYFGISPVCYISVRIAYLCSTRPWPYSKRNKRTKTAVAISRSSSTFDFLDALEADSAVLGVRTECNTYD